MDHLLRTQQHRLDPADPEARAQLVNALLRLGPKAPALGWRHSSGLLHMLGRWQQLPHKGDIEGGPIPLMAAARGNVVRAVGKSGHFGGCSHLRWRGEPLELVDLAEPQGRTACTYCVRTVRKLQRRFGWRDAFTTQRNTLFACGWTETLWALRPEPTPCWLPHAPQRNGSTATCVHCGLMAWHRTDLHPGYCPARSRRATPEDWTTGERLAQLVAELGFRLLDPVVHERYLVARTFEWTAANGEVFNIANSDLFRVGQGLSAWAVPPTQRHTSADPTLLRLAFSPSQVVVTAPVTH